MMKITETKRQAAMKRFFKSVDTLREQCKYPCKNIKVDGKLYNSFLNEFCFALTTESIGDTETYDNSLNTYLNLNDIVKFDNAESVEKINLNNLFAKAKTKGYRYKKSECDAVDFQYIFKYKDTCYKIGLLDKAFSIVNDGELAEVYYIGKFKPLLIKTSIGIAGVCSMRDIKNIEQIKTVIYLED